MNPFAYHRPANVEEAVRALAGTADGRYLAGGQSLLPTMKLGLAAPTDLIDLGRIGSLRGVRVDGEVVRIGAGTPHAQVAAHDGLARAVPALARLAGLIGDPAVRARGTIGGSLALNDPAACWPAAVLGLGATVRTDRRTIAADAFFVGLYETALEPGELIVEVAFPVPARAAWQKFPQPASRFSLVGVFVSRGRAGVRVAVTGAASCVFRATGFETVLAAEWSAAALAGVRQSAQALNADLHASAEYRAHLVGVLCRRAVAAAGG